MKFKTVLLYVSILYAGMILSDHDTWLESLGGFFIFLAGAIAGCADGKESNKLSDHFRRMTKR